MNLEARVALVTGASRGIGREIARQLAAAGASVACVATSQSNAQSIADQIVNDGGVAKPFGCDVSNSSAVKETVHAVNEALGPPLILVNNAGIARDTLMMRMKDEDWDDVLAVNLKGAFNTIKACHRGMMKARWGRIVNIASVVGISGNAGQTNYAASKAGLVGFTKSLARELASRNITVNAVAPGLVPDTGMTSDLDDEAVAKIMSQVPAGRPGTP